jgi:hypothetical protein
LKDAHLAPNPVEYCIPEGVRGLALLPYIAPYAFTILYKEGVRVIALITKYEQAIRMCAQRQHTTAYTAFTEILWGNHDFSQHFNIDELPYFNLTSFTIVLKPLYSFTRRDSPSKVLTPLWGPRRRELIWRRHEYTELQNVNNIDVCCNVLRCIGTLLPASLKECSDVNDAVAKFDYPELMFLFRLFYKFSKMLEWDERQLQQHFDTSWFDTFQCECLHHLWADFRKKRQDLDVDQLCNVCYDIKFLLEVEVQLTEAYLPWTHINNSVQPSCDDVDDLKKFAFWIFRTERASSLDMFQELPQEDIHFDLGKTLTACGRVDETCSDIEWLRTSLIKRVHYFLVPLMKKMFREYLRRIWFGMRQRHEYVRVELSSVHYSKLCSKLDEILQNICKDVYGGTPYEAEMFVIGGEISMAALRRVQEVIERLGEWDHGDLPSDFVTSFHSNWDEIVMIRNALMHWLAINNYEQPELMSFLSEVVGIMARLRKLLSPSPPKKPGLLKRLTLGLMG